MRRLFFLARKIRLKKLEDHIKGKRVKTAHHFLIESVSLPPIFHKRFMLSVGADIYRLAESFKTFQMVNPEGINNPNKALRDKKRAFGFY